MQEPSYGLLSGRNIARKRDFCSFQGMKHLLAVILMFICSGTQASAFSCNDFSAELHKIVEERNQLDQTYKSLPNSSVLTCQFFRTQFVPHLEQKLERIRSFSECPQWARIVKLYETETENHITDIKAGEKKFCK
jgi:hypothetical protein